MRGRWYDLVMFCVWGRWRYSCFVKEEKNGLEKIGLYGCLRCVWLSGKRTQNKFEEDVGANRKKN